MSRVSNNSSGIPSTVGILAAMHQIDDTGMKNSVNGPGRNIRIRIEFGMIDQHIGIER
jgi:hypothetical protein